MVIFVELESPCSQFIFIGGLVSRGKKVTQFFNDKSHVPNVIMFHFWVIFNYSCDTICLKRVLGLRDWRYRTLKWQFLPLERLLMLKHLLKKIMKEGMVFVLREKERQANRRGLGEGERTPTHPTSDLHVLAEDENESGRRAEISLSLITSHWLTKEHMGVERNQSLWL